MPRTPTLFALFLAFFSASLIAEPATQPIYTLPPDQVKYVKGYPAIPPDIKAAAEAQGCGVGSVG